MLFAIFGLGFWESSAIIFVLMCGLAGHLAKKAVSSPTVQKGAASWLLGRFK